MSPRNRAAHVRTDLSDARIERMWEAIAPRLDRKPWPRWPLATVAAVAAVIAIVYFVRSRPGGATLAEGIAFERGDAPTLTLVDGSRIALDGSSRVRVLRARTDDVEVEVEKGGAVFDIVPSMQRRFVIRAGEVRVRVVGTRLHVVRAGDGHVTVSVDHGRVEITRPGDDPARVLAQGETWSTAPGSTSPSASAPEPPPDPSSAEPPDPSSHPSAPPPAPSAPAFPARVGSAGPKELLELAQSARLQGRPRDAAAALDALRKRYRNDGRAGLAAFELARLRMDALGDRPGAAEALDDAIRLAPNAPFREDAEARKVALLDAPATIAVCVAARDAYLARYPKGVHAAVVAKRCGGR